MIYVTRWIFCIFYLALVFSKDDGLPPSFVYLEPIEDFFIRSPIALEIIVTDRNEVDIVSLFYRFEGEDVFTQRQMDVGVQPVIFNIEIPLDEVISSELEYYFWARDQYGNEATWPRGGEDMPIVLPIYSSKETSKDKLVQKKPKEFKGYDPPENLKDNLPYYLELSMLAPESEVKYEEGVPIVVISVYDPELIVNQEKIKFLIDGKPVVSYNSADMITYIPQDSFKPGYHILTYEAEDLSGKQLIKELYFFVEEEIIDDTVDKISFKEQIKFKGDLGLNTDYSPYGSPIDLHKVNSSIKFELGDYKFNISGLASTYLLDSEAREKARFQQPSTRLKFNMKSKYIDINYGDNSVDFSDMSLKGTRVRGINTNIRWGTWEASFVSGETKHKINKSLYDIDPWENQKQYNLGDRAYYKGAIWENYNLNNNPPDLIIDSTLIGIDSLILEITDTDTLWEYIQNWNPIYNWNDLYYSNENDAPIGSQTNFALISNDICTDIELAAYGYDPINGGDTLYTWNDGNCEQVVVYSRINMLTGENGVEKQYLFENYAECVQTCQTPINYQKGSPIRFIQGLRTSKIFSERFKFGISAIRSWDIRDESLVPYSLLDEFTYEANLAASTDFSLSFNDDQTIISGEYGISLTMDQSYSDTLLLKSINDIDYLQSLYSYYDWSDVDYCITEHECVDVNGDGKIVKGPEFVEGVIMNEELWQEILSSREQLDKMESILGFSINDDINNYIEGRGFSGLTGPEINEFFNGSLSDRISLLSKKPAYKVVFKTPIPLIFTEVKFQTEFNQAPINYLSHGSSSIQTDVRNWKNKLAFKILKNQLNVSMGFDKQIKSPWDPISESEGEIKRSITNTQSASFGFSFKKLPPLNYSIRLQNRGDYIVNYIDDQGGIIEDLTGKKKMLTHTIAPSLKFNLGELKINLNGNINLAYDIDMLADSSGCYQYMKNGISNYQDLNNDGVVNIFDVTESIAICNHNEFYFLENENPIKDRGNLTSTYTSAISLSFPSPLSVNIGWGVSTNAPSDIRQSETIVNVYSTKIGYKFLENKFSVTIGANYVESFKDANGFWDSGEIFINDNLQTEYFQGDTFSDLIEVNNNKLSIKAGCQYKIPDQNLSIGFNLDYSRSNDIIKNELSDPTIKAKFSIKYGF